MNRINDNMLAVAKFLQQQDQMSWANSVGLSDHPDHALAGMGQAAAPFNL